MSKKKPAPTSGTSYRSVLSITALSSTGKALRFLPAPLSRQLIAKRHAKNDFSFLLPIVRKAPPPRPCDGAWAALHNAHDNAINFRRHHENYVIIIVN